MQGKVANNRVQNSSSSSSEEGFLLGLGACDLVDHDANTALGDDVRHAVAQLDGDHRGCSIDAQHGEQVHNRVSAPGDDGHDLGRLDLARNHWVALACGCSCQTDKKFVHNVEEEAHGQEPAEPTWGEVTGDNQLTVITRDIHEGRAETKSPGLAAVLLWGQLHHQQDFDQKEWHCEEPIHVSVCIVERNTCQNWVRHTCRVLIGIHPRVEDPDVMVGSDEGHQTGDEHSTLVLSLHCKRPEPQEHGGG